MTDTNLRQIAIPKERYEVVAPETMQETFMSESEDEGGMRNFIFYSWFETLLRC